MYPLVYIRFFYLANSQLSSLYPPSPSFSSFGAAFVMLCCSPPPVCSSTPLRLSVYCLSVGSVVNISYVRTFCDHLNVFNTFDPTCIVLKPGLISTARMPRLVRRPLVLPDEQPPTPSPRRWPALITLPTLAKFHLVWRRICDVVLFLSCLFERTLSAVCLLPEYRPGLSLIHI